LDVAETSVYVDAAPPLEAALHAEVLWPDPTPGRDH